MTWLWDILNKPKLEVSTMDELKVSVFALMVLLGVFVAWSVISIWFEKRKP